MKLVVSPEATQYIKTRLDGVITVIPPAELGGAGCCGGGIARRPALVLAGPPNGGGNFVRRELTGVVVHTPKPWEVGETNGRCANCGIAITSSRSFTKMESV